MSHNRDPIAAWIAVHQVVQSSTMSLVSLSHVSKRFDGPLILDDVTLDIEKGRKIGVIGRNGTGKSTLLRMIAGEEGPSDGQLFRTRGIRVAFQTQELAGDPRATAIEAMSELFEDTARTQARLRQVEHDLGTSPDPLEEKRLLEEYARLQDALHASGGYDVQQTITAVLSGLGLPEESWHQPMGSFSGGERNIIGLARILLLEPELILLDEPSNHLDMDGRDWFIRFARNSKATIVMVSHDRHVLDSTAQEIWEIEGRAVTRWAGNYTAFRARKEEALALQARRFKNQEKLIKRIEFQARRLRDMAKAYDDPGQAKRAKAMLNRIEKMDRVEDPKQTDRRFSTHLQRGERHGRIALTVTDYSFNHGDRILFDHAQLEIEHGQRVCLVGPNGSGKSTLFQSVLTEGSWENPVLRLGKSVRVGEYRQLHEDVMERETSIVDWIQRTTGLFLQPASELLHRFLFTREDLDRAVGTLSGGEKSRLQLARLVNDQVNFLMLDEPTNHLDIQACEQLEEMLQGFDGTLFIISHDRWFLDKLVDVVVEVKDRSLERFQGTLGHWWEARHEAGEARLGGALTMHSQKEAAKEQKTVRKAAREARRQRQRDRQRLQGQVRRIEDQIHGLEAEQVELTEAMEKAWSGGSESVDTRDLEARLTAANSRLETLMADWETASAQAAEMATEDSAEDVVDRDKSPQ